MPINSFHKIDAAKEILVRVNRNKYEAAVPPIFRTDEILARAGVKVTKTEYVAPLSAFRFLVEDADAQEFAKQLKVDARTKTVQVKNTDALRMETLPWCGPKGDSGFGPAYANWIAAGMVPDPLTLRMVRPAKPRVKKDDAATKTKSGGGTTTKGKASTAPAKRTGGKAATLASRAKAARSAPQKEAVKAEA